MSVKNSTILERAWLEAGNDYQQRIPDPSVSSYAEHVAALFDPMNNDLFNQFSGLLNGLMGTYVESKLFENPLAVLKKPAAQFGNSERHVAVRYLQAHSYRADSETLLRVERPEYREWFYSVGKPRRYDFSWSKYELQRAFASDGYGYDELLEATITQAYSSDNYDEMNIMIQMFAEADQRMGGLYRYQVSAFPTDEATGKELLTGIRATAGRMKFPTTLYNHLDVPVHENGDTLVLWVTPDTAANLDVNTLSSVFQLDKAEVQYRIITIPEFPIPNVCAALTSEDFIYCRDVWYGIEPPFYNPENLTLKYYLHHSELIGVNPAANCVLFTTDTNTVIPTVVQAVTGMTLTAESETASLGDEVKFTATLTGTMTPETEPLTVQPNAAMFSVAAAADGEPVALNSRTYVDSYGVLHIQRSGLAVGTVITVTAQSAYINPSGTTTVYTASATVTIE
jgi:hypothetical protein